MGIDDSVQSLQKAFQNKELRPTVLRWLQNAPPGQSSLDLMLSRAVLADFADSEEECVAVAQAHARFLETPFHPDCVAWDDGMVQNDEFAKRALVALTYFPKYLNDHKGTPALSWYWQAGMGAWRTLNPAVAAHFGNWVEHYQQFFGEMFNQKPRLTTTQACSSKRIKTYEL